MENADNSPELQPVGKIEDSRFTTSAQVNPQEAPRKKRAHPERELPPFPFLYQG